MLDLVDERDRIVFGGDLAVALLVDDQPARAGAEPAGTLAGRDQRGGREERPVEVPHGRQVAVRVAVRERDGLVRIRKALGIDELLAGSDFERARAAHDDDALHARLARAVDERLRDRDDLRCLLLLRPIGARDDVLAFERGGDARRIEQVGRLRLHVRAARRRVARQRRHLMAAARRFGGDPRADHAGCAEQGDFQSTLRHGDSPGCKYVITLITYSIKKTGIHDPHHSHSNARRDGRAAFQRMAKSSRDALAGSVTHRPRPAAPLALARPAAARSHAAAPAACAQPPACCPRGG
ncbi:hypothetical protein DM46_2964 [Burkholderia mallei]|nr:hypothetical protein DM46_2964 [Burkholderia mallei]